VSRHKGRQSLALRPTESRDIGKVKRWIQTFSTARSPRSAPYHDGRQIRRLEQKGQQP
jgi:hypothetical protein